MGDKARPDITIIVPTYNEKDNIPELLSRIDSSLRSRGINYEVVIVDDNSPDGTAEVALKLSSKYPVKVLKRPGKLGLASAVIDGLKLASSNLVVVMDADLQHPPEVIPKLYEEALKGYDIVIASRYVKGGSVGNWSFTRKLISKAAIVLAHILVPRTRGIKDVTSGFFLFRKEIINNANLSPRGFKILMEILAKGRYSKVTEVPYKFSTRKYGRSKLSRSEIINYMIHLINLSPTYLKFALVGATGTLVNLGILALLRYVFGLIHEVAAAISIEASIINNFILNDLWTFKHRRRGSWALRLIKFHISCALAVITQYIVSVAIYHLLIAESVIAQLIGILAGFIVNYLISKTYVWR